MRSVPSHALLTFYHFVDIPEAEVARLVAEQREFCQDIGLRGRVYIGTEGISSTVTGNRGQLRAYRAYLESTGFFAGISGIDAKSTPVDGHQFAKMIVKAREEIVTLGRKVTAGEVARYKKELDPAEFKRLVDSGEADDWLILDMRNDYEYELGHFKGAVPAGTDNFREMPDLVERYRTQAGNKKIVWYCTGGIRCEKAAVIMNQAGLEDVYSLSGGVVEYVNAYDDGNWLGNLYTFDGRVSTRVGSDATHVTIGRCRYTGESTDEHYNCRYAACNAHLLATSKAYRKHAGFCSAACAEGAKRTGLVRAAAWDKFDYRTHVRAAKRADDATRAAMMAQVREHIERMLGKTVFAHEAPDTRTQLAE